MGVRHASVLHINEILTVIALVVLIWMLNYRGILSDGSARNAILACVLIIPASATMLMLGVANRVMARSHGSRHHRRGRLTARRHGHGSRRH